MSFDRASSPCDCSSIPTSGNAGPQSADQSPDLSGRVYRNIDEQAMNWIVSESLYFDGNATGVPNQPQDCHAAAPVESCSTGSYQDCNYANYDHPPYGYLQASYPQADYTQGGYYPCQSYPVGSYPPQSPTAASYPPLTDITPQPSPTDSEPQPGSQSQLSGSFPDYWSYRYPNGTEPSWDNNYAGSQFSSPLDNSSSIHYAQTYTVTPQRYDATGATGYYNQYSWQRQGPGGAYGGSVPFHLSQAELDYAAKRGE